MVKESGNSLWGLKTTVETLIHNLSQTSLYAHRNEDTEKKKKTNKKLQTFHDSDQKENQDKVLSSREISMNLHLLSVISQ